MNDIDSNVQFMGLRLAAMPLSECLCHTVYLVQEMRRIKGTVQHKTKNTYFCIVLLPVALFISLDSFGVSCLVLKTSVIENSVFSLIQWE